SIGAHQVIEVNGQGAHDVGLAGQFHQESEYPQDVAGTKLVLSELAKASNPNANMEFVDKMLTEADCIILRDEGRVTDEGAVVQERNAAMGEGRQAPVTRPVEDARVTEMMRRLATLNNDVRYLDASFTVLANFVGLRRDEVVTAATQLLLHGGHAGTGVKAEAGGTKNAPRTPQRPSAHKGRDDSSPEEDGVRNATRVVLASTFAASGAGVWGDTRGKETVKAEEEEDLVSDIDDEEDDDEACASKYTALHTEEEGAFAYAAGAFVLRPRDKIPNTVSLSAAEKAMLAWLHQRRFADPGGSAEVVEVEELAGGAGIA
ncbi:unnamed protein product, partial [Closterium sp. NIES-64]